MVFPIIGARDYIEQRGFFVHPCPSCNHSRVFAVYDTRRKLTLYFIPTLKVRSQLVMECMTCHGRWGITDEQQPAVVSGLMTQEQLSRYLGNGQSTAPAAAAGGPVGRTLYQDLQVDQEADPDVIEAAFKRLALKHHPDRSTDAGAESRMRSLITARDILTNPVRRRAYDASLGIVRRIEALRPEEV